MESIAAALVKLYLPAALGILFSRAAKPSGEFFRTLSKALLYSFLPLLLFASIYGTNPLELAAGFTQMAVAVAVNAAISATASYLLTRDSEIVQLSVYVNAGYLPIPIAYTLWGPSALPLVGFYILFNASLGYLLAPALIKGDLRSGLKEMLRFPPLYAILAGLLASLVGAELPGFAAEALRDVSNVAPYLALFALGAQVSQAGFRVDGKTAKLAAVRFFVAPLAVWLSAPLYLAPNSLPYRVALLESCMPPAVTNVVLSSVYSTEPGKTARAVFSLTLMSMLVVPAAMVLLS